MKRIRREQRVLATGVWLFDRPAIRTGIARRTWWRAILSEQALALVGIALVGLHLIDDAYLQPEPGTSAGDHLIGGGVPIALLALAAASCTSLRKGARAWLALAIGSLAVGVGCAVPVFHTVTEGPAGSDYSGIVAAVGGLLLLVVGLATLWKSRRTDERRRRRYARRLGTTAVALVIAVQVIAPIGIAYAITHMARPSVTPVDLGAPYEAVTFTTSDGLRLAGWYVPSRNGAAVIVFPGRSGPVEHARMLVRHGYGVLLFDPRGRGESDGDPNALGWNGERDLLAALAFLKGRPDIDPARIGGLGLSVGGELLLQTAARTDDLKAVVAEGAGFRSLGEYLEAPSSAAKWLLLPHISVLIGATAAFAGDTPPPNLIDLVSRIAPRPMFLIYATHGQGGEELNPAYYAAAAEPKILWAIPEAGHTDGLSARPEEYERRVIAFFDAALLAAA